MGSSEWTTTPEPDNVRALRAEVRAYASRNGLCASRVHDVALAVSEIVSNAVLHAYRDGSYGTITVGAKLVDDEIVIRVVDDGIGMSPRTDSPGAGMGLMIAGTLANRMLIERPERGGTAVSMTFAPAA